jgi:NIMA (never in mitosis gene a)-related kinase
LKYSHKNIVSYKEAFLSEDGQALCIVMEYADGGDLYDKIVAHKKNKTRFEEGDIWEIFVQIVKGLRYLHEMKILH